jgi:hypothetical protein
MYNSVAVDIDGEAVGRADVTSRASSLGVVDGCRSKPARATVVRSSR